jgi:subtilisin
MSAATPPSALPEQYVVLPRIGLRAEPGTSSVETRQFLTGLTEASTQVRVVDSIGPDGAKLIEASPEAVLALRREQPGLRVVPVRYYFPAVARRSVDASVAPKAPGSPVKLEIVSAKDGAPVVGAFVVAFVDFARQSGDQGVTDATGKVALALGGPDTKLDRLYVYPLDGYWSRLQESLVATDGTKVELQPLDLGYKDGLRHYYGNAADDAGAGVTVAVIDTGVSKHPDLTVAGGANTVPGEDPKDYGDNGQHHGTHVAGIIAAHGHPPSGVRGVAPGVTLRAYRVFGKGSGQGSSFAIAKAIDMAVADGCDLINMSLGGGQPDATLTAAVEAARSGGSLCIIAAGNGDRAPVAFPASDAMAMAVSALGRTGTFPAGVAETDDVADPHGTDPADFIAAFSNVGPEIDLTGPGVGIISTVPGGYAEISGTSMACPAVTGMAARVIAKSGALKKPRDAARSDAIAKAVLASAKSLGFAAKFAGHGLLLQT